MSFRIFYFNHLNFHKTKICTIKNTTLKLQYVVRNFLLGKNVKCEYKTNKLNMYILQKQFFYLDDNSELNPSRGQLRVCYNCAFQ